MYNLCLACVATFFCGSSVCRIFLKRDFSECATSMMVSWKITLYNIKVTIEHKIWNIYSFRYSFSIKIPSCFASVFSPWSSTQCLCILKDQLWIIKKFPQLRKIEKTTIMEIIPLFWMRFRPEYSYEMMVDVGEGLLLPL